MNIECPQCHRPQRQTKAGLTRVGSQRYFCGACAKTYTPRPKAPGHPPHLRQQALTLLREGLSQRKVACLLQVAPQSVANWLTVAHAYLEQQEEQTLPTQANLACAVVEMDELYSFAGAKRGSKKPRLSAHPD